MTRFTVFLILISLTIALISCGESSKTSKIAIVTPEKTSVSGDLNGYIEVLDNEYELIEDWGAKISIKIKALQPYPNVNSDNFELKLLVSLLSENGMPVSGTSDLDIEYDSKEKLFSLIRSGTGEEVILLKSSFGYSAEDHAEKVKKFSISSSLIPKEKSSNAAQNTDEEWEWDDDDEEDENTSNNEDWDKLLDDYEDYVTKLIQLQKKANDGDISALTDMASLMEKAEKLEDSLSDAEDDLSPAQIQRLLKINQKIMESAY